MDCVSHVKDIQEIIKLTAKRSVYDLKELEGHIDNAQQKDKTVSCIDFYVCGHLNPPIGVEELVSKSVFNNRPPQAPMKLEEARFEKLKHLIKLDF